MLGIAAQTSFRAVAMLPAILLLVFAGVWLYDRARGGHKGKMNKEVAEFSLELRRSATHAAMRFDSVIP